MLNLSSKPLTVVFSVLLIFLQFSIWSSNGGLSQIIKLKQAIAVSLLQNQHLQEKNMILAADVEDLKHGLESIEEQARDLGMVKSNEIFYQIID